MDRTNRLAYANIVQILIDVIFLFLTYSLAYFIAGRVTNLRVITEYLWIIIVFIPLWIATMNFRGMYDKTTFYYPDRVLRNVFLATLFSGIILAAIFFFIKETSTSRIFIGCFLLLCLIVMLLDRFFISPLIGKSKYNEQNRMILVCSPETYELFNKYLNKTHIRYNIIGVVSFDDRTIDHNIQSLGKIDKNTFEDILKKQMVDLIVFALPNEYTQEVEPYISTCLSMGITVQSILNYNLKFARVHSSMLGPMPLLTFHTVTLNPVSKAIKRIMDILGAIVGIILTLIIAIYIVPAIKMDSSGPILFKQKRVGRYGRIFYCYKFRTMCVDAEEKKKELRDKNEYQNGLFFKIKEDPRITKVGAFLRKTSLDELPQFFNVLKGDMSLVGTRPPTLDEVAQYDTEHWRRISIKPGITGNWQINGRSSITDFEQIVALDTQYIDKWSIWLDISILFKTVLLVIRRESAY
ncbi:sugar transferase [Dehalobacter restrictus]|uniref:Exopolysaccharide biosynthesis polyprenyl glycosylphosphotransferase n=1 Tax=Dehalobacter restrictus TaxID=55583 RepID=A0A857DI26_9FIRM|nr:sugar transferase [Dehalobacter restrictus]QHA00944.1 exopolysaccharide biosynthesis polyprenyl glycosylphosphotransferase [Dehalobacter restrictus]